MLTVLGASLVGGTQATAQAPEPPADPPAVAPAPVEGGEIIHRWAIGPAGSDDPSQPSNRSSLSYTAAPGAVINDAVTLYNLGNVDLDFMIYATDAENAENGALGLLSRDETPSEVGSWTSLGADSVALAAGRQVTIPLQVAVPNDVRPGDHLGAVVASSSTESGEGQVGLDRRTATIIQIRVDGPTTSELAISELRADFDNSINPFDGNMSVSYTLENRGDVALSGTSSVTVGGPLGIGEQTLPPFEFATLLPGEDIVVTADVDGLSAAGVLTTRVEVQPEDSGDSVVLEPISRTTSTFAPPVLLLLLSLVTLFAVLTFRALRRHRQRALDETTPTTPEREPQPV